MNKLNLSTISKSVRTVMKKHSPKILTGIGIAGMITTVIMAVKATPKAVNLIEKKKNETDADKLTLIETVKTAWTCYIPATITGVVSIACLIGANSVNERRNAALATAYTLSESASKIFQNKVVETIGEKKTQAVKDAIAKETIDRNPVSNQEIIMTEKGNALCYDVISGRYFKSDIDKINKAVNELNRQMRDEMYISLNDFYYEIGLGSIKIGEDLGWHIDESYIDLKFSSQLADDGTPCLVINYSVAPQYDYYCK